MDNKILRKRTITVIIITLVMMIAEIYFGLMTHSMALTADGFHMGTHVLAFTITLAVCLFAMKYCDKAEKFNALGGYTSSILLGATSVGIIYESVERLISPEYISFEEAILVAVIGLVVNLLCIYIMEYSGVWHNHKHEHGHEHFDCDCHNREHNDEKQENLNYKAAYLHIVADAMTSILAIGALVLGKYFGWTPLDAIIGVLGGIIIAKWSIDLFKSSSKVLLDFD